MLKGLKKYLPKIKRIFLLLWVLTVLLFIFAQTRAPGDYAKMPGNPWGQFFGIDVVSGVLFFVLTVFFYFVDVDRKKKRSTKLSKNENNLSNRVFKYLLFSFALLFCVLVYVLYKDNTLVKSSTPKNIEISSPSPTQSPSPNPTVKGTFTSDPVITCNINANCGGGSRQLKQSICNIMTCCTIDARCGGPKFITKSECSNSYCCFFSDGTGKLLGSKSECDNYYSNTPSNNLPVTNTYTPTTYYTCTLYYPALNLYQTYNSLYKTKEECDVAQEKINQIGGSTYQTPTPQPTFDTQAYNAQVEQCQSSVIERYDSLLRGCQIRYGDSSATEACQRIYTDQRQKDYEACGKKI